MSFKQLKMLLAAAFLGTALVGCSSNPELDDTETGASQAVTDTQAAKESLENATEEELGKLNELLAALQGKKVNFEFDKSDVNSEFYEIIKMHAEYLNLAKDAKVTIEGHCDERGSREYNLALGERRANAVKNALIAEGVEAGRIDVISFGEDRPLASGSNEEAWAQNRRAEFSY